MASLHQFSLDGRNFVVTGASSGIGRALAGYLADAGGSVVLVARRESELDSAAHSIREQGGQADYLSADLSDRSTLPDLAWACKAKFDSGIVDGVINAAGVNLREPVDQVSLESWDLTLNLNLATPFFFTREFIPEMRAQKFGRVINIASLQSTRAFPNGLAYGASKGGICQLTRAMAEAWSGDGICCNAIAPGFFPTELTGPVFENPETREWAAGQTTIGRNGELDDLFGITVFFASAASAYITGQTLAIDGGFTAK
ncbi:MAG: NAD(P)-dependent dehydrogenase (short-subunit alcohol dehydrogenase family) [Planctomycetota bacterium]|jgi:NAD(P)-dependent dehydrogenase (short-subunit alcohol dehydrogenase family)